MGAMSAPNVNRRAADGFPEHVGLRTAWFHCYAGITGGTALGALIDAGADETQVRKLVERLPVTGWDISREVVKRNGIGAIRASVDATPDRSVVRTIAHMNALIEEARFPTRLRWRVETVFEALARDDRIGRGWLRTIEVAGLDVIVKTVAVCAALEVLDIEELHCSQVALGVGTVKKQNGLVPIPDPLAVSVLASRGAVTYGREVGAELTDIVGAAIVAALSQSFGAMPAMAVDAIGHGAAAMEIDGLPLLTQVVLGRQVAQRQPTQQLSLLEANVDDVSGEVLAHTIDALLAAGANEAWLTPIMMLRGRPAQTISALIDPLLADQLRQVLADETGILTVRERLVDQWIATRHFDEVEVHGHPVRIKVGPGRAKAEHDDAAKVARLLNVSVREVSSLAESQWRRMQEARHFHPGGRG
jgi:pyridinium-3,5-bisthiocarboxylic acid mononucleotide nickel chelatase